MNRHELYGRDTEFLKVFDDRRIGQSGIGASNIRRYVLVEVGHAAYMGLVDDGIVV